jgi:hypothetical protein
MTRAPLFAIALLSLSPLVAAPVRAQAPSPPPPVDRPGFDLGLRLGYALPMGSVAEGSDLSDGISGQIPLQVDALYRVNSQYAVGGYVGYGYAFVKDEGCDPGASCSGSVLRIGVQGTIRFPSASSFVPWVGAGFGYEWLKLKESAGGQSATLTVKGFEFLSLQAGGEFRSSSEFSIGPFVSLSFARYSSGEVGGVSGDINDPAFHEWLQFGLRGLFSL